MLEALVGAAVGVLTILFARSVRGERWVYSAGLLVLPGLYTCFALQAGEQAAVFKEMIYGVPFVVAGLFYAFVSVRWSAIVVGLFWLLHGVFDLVHSQLFINIGVPVWYPIFCFVVDVVVGMYLLLLARRVPDANLRLTQVEPVLAIAIGSLLVTANMIVSSVIFIIVATRNVGFRAVLKYAPICRFRTNRITLTYTLPLIQR